jgi:two-component system cell cycle sensor histidine kinase/response regulator CckA
MTKCLIVEDEPLIAFDLQCRLERAGYSVSGIADRMSEVVQILETDKPDLVFMDISIKGDHDGVETADLIRRKYDLPVIFVTTHADTATLERAKRTGPFGYIVKPFATVDFRAQSEIAIWKHNMEQRLRLSEAWLASILHNVADAIIATGPDGTVVFLNSAAETLTGWSSAEAAGKPLLEVFCVYSEETGQPILNPLEYIYDGRGIEPHPATYFLQHRDPCQSTLVETRVSVNEDEHGLIGIVVCFSDVAERQKAQEQRRQLEKTQALALLATGYGRELSDWLRDTESCLQELLSQIPDRLREVVRSAYLSASNAIALARQLTELGSREAGQAEPVDLNALLSEVKKSLVKMEGVKWPIALDLDPSLPAIAVEPESCRQNLIRLLQQAKKAMPKGGEIYVSTQLVETTTSEHAVQLIVRDNGKRLRSSAQHRIFDPYYDLGANSYSAGLSLPLVYHFVSVNGGSIQCSSSKEGTEVRISFPALVTPDRPILIHSCPKQECPLR